MRITKGLVTKIVFALTMTVIAITQINAQAVQPVADRSQSPIVSGNDNPALKSPITLTARDASLSEVLRVLADRSGMNFVVGEGVERERITIILNNTPLDESVNLLVRASGLSYEIIGNSILIAQPDRLREDVGLSAYVVELKYARAEEVSSALEHLTKNITVDRGGNRLIVYASPRVIMEVERIVRAIDRPHILVLLETRLIEVRADRMHNYGLQWQSLSPDANFFLGTQISVPEGPLRNGFNFSGATRTPINLNVALDLMVQNGDGRMLMDSKLTTTNNREASLHIGEIVPYVIQSYNIGGTGGANEQIQKENVGVILRMTPHINEDDQVTLTLSPEVSSITGWRGANADIPLVRTRRTSTTVRVENGQTVILAGLLSEEQTTAERRLPILGDIPVLGMLFRNKRDETIMTNLIIEVVPRIIHDPEEISRYMTMQLGSQPQPPPRNRRAARREQRQRQQMQQQMQQHQQMQQQQMQQQQQARPQPAPQPASAPQPQAQPAPQPQGQPAPQPTPQGQPTPQPTPQPQGQPTPVRTGGN